MECNEIEKGIINKNVRNVIDQCIGRITRQIQRQFFAQYDSYSKVIETEPIMDCTRFINNLKNGDFELLRNVMNYRESKKQLSFSKYLQYEKKGIMESNISQYFTDITDKIINIFEVAFENVNELCNLKDEYEKNIQYSSKDKISQPSNNKISKE